MEDDGFFKHISGMKVGLASGEPEWLTHSKLLPASHRLQRLIYLRYDMPGARWRLMDLKLVLYTTNLEINEFSTRFTDMIFITFIYDTANSGIVLRTDVIIPYRTIKQDKWDCLMGQIIPRRI